MKAVGDKVVIETTLTKKVVSILMPGETEKDSYTPVHKVTSVGKLCKDDSIKVGSTVIFAHYAEPMHVENISGKVGDPVIIQHAIMAENFIAGIK